MYLWIWVGSGSGCGWVLRSGWKNSDLTTNLCLLALSSNLWVPQGENGAGEESSDEMHPGRTYLASKPLSPITGTSSDAVSPPSGQSESAQHLMLANENIYIFFRYHR